MTARPIRCTGRRVDRLGQPAGRECGRRLTVAVELAGAIGWRVGEPGPDGARDAMCPRCAAPEAADTPDAAPVLAGQLDLLSGQTELF